MEVTREQALSEAYSRGILPPEMNDAYEEAMSRGLIPNISKQHNSQQPNSSSNAIPGNLSIDIEKDITTGDFPNSHEKATDSENRGIIGNFGMGVVHGIDRALAGPSQLIVNGLSKIGVPFPKTPEQFTNDIQDRLDFYDKGNLGKEGGFSAGLGDFVGSVAPWVAGGAAAKGIPILGEALAGSNAGAGLLNRLGMGALGGTIVGGSQFVPEGGSRERNAIIGGILGGGINAVLPPVINATSFIYNKGKDIIKKGYGYITGKPESAIADNVLAGINQRTLSGLPQEEAQQTLSKTKNTYDAGQRLGLQLTPAEASGNPLTSARQGALGNTDEAAQNLVAFGRRQEAAQQKAIDNLLDTITPNANIANAEARDAAQKIIKGEQQKLIKQAQPLYQQAEQEAVPKSVYSGLRKDSNIELAINQVKRDPIYKSELKGYNANQLKILDLAKRNLDDKIEAATRAGENNKARILIKSKDKLVSALDEISPEYKQARQIYTEGMPSISALTKGDLGRIADLSDPQLQNVSRMIFDTAETDINTLIRIRDHFVKQNPDLWRRIVRNSMESKMEASRQATAGKPGSAFYNGLLSTDRQFNQYLQALKGIPGAQEMLIDMRSAFKNLIPVESVKGAAGKAKSSLNVPRNSVDAVLGMVDNLMGGKYDKAAVDLITTEKWLPYLKEIKKIKDPRSKANAYANLLGRISAQQATVSRSQE